jgi:DNA mismatch endonuclease (patch repair protein)
MASIRGADTRPEMILRRGLHSLGWRYRLHVRALPGTPDLVFPRRRAAVFVHGCFWHGHACPLFKVPRTDAERWLAKIETNQARDAAAQAQLLADGWRVLTVWECAMRGRARWPINELLAEVHAWLEEGGAAGEFAGRWPAASVPSELHLNQDKGSCHRPGHV